MSPKNKGKLGQSKVTAVPETDEFISGVDRVFRALKPHAARLAVVGGVVAVIVVAYALWNGWQERKEAHATDLYVRAVALGQVPVKAPEAEGDKEAPEADRKPDRPDPRGLPAEYKSEEERSLAVLALLEELSSEYGSTGVARQALLLEAETLYQLGRYKDAAERYRTYADGEGPPELILSAREGLAYSLEAEAMAQKDAKTRESGLEVALKAFGDVQPKNDGPRRDEALYHQARIQAELGRKDQALKMFEQILADYPGSSLKPDIEMRLPALRTASPAK